MNENTQHTTSHALTASLSANAIRVRLWNEYESSLVMQRTLYEQLKKTQYGTQVRADYTRYWREAWQHSSQLLAAFNAVNRIIASQ